MKCYYFYLLLMSATKQPKDQNKKIQFTPALQKLYNRICARVYRGNPRKKCSRDKLLSVQHSQILKKCSFGAMITTCRPPYQGNNSIRNRQFASETASNANPCHHEIKMKKLTSYLTQRKTPIQFDRPFRCRTQSIKFVSTAYLAKNRQTSPDLMDTDLFHDRQNKIQPAVRNRPTIKTENLQHFPSQVYSQNLRSDNRGTPSKVRQGQDRRKINNMIRTKNKLAAELGKHQREQSFFKPWDVEQNDDLFF